MLARASDCLSDPCQFLQIGEKISAFPSGNRGLRDRSDLRELSLCSSQNKPTDVGDGTHGTNMRI